MPGFFTDYLNDKMLDLVFGSAAFPIPPTLYVGLSGSSANRCGRYHEPSGSGYARVAMINDLISFKESVNGIKVNAKEVIFPTPNGDWGWMRSVFIADSASGGNVLAMSDLKEPRSFHAGDEAVRIPKDVLCFTVF